MAIGSVASSLGPSRAVRWFTAAVCGILSLFPAAALPVSQISFTEVSTQVGLGEIKGDGPIPAVGVVWFDYDGDGWDDLFIANGEVQPDRIDLPNALLRNRGDGTFEDVTAHSGLADNRVATGAAAGDLDGDGDLDLYVTIDGPNALFRNNGDGTFTDIAAEAGVDDPRSSYAVALGDYDLDGDLDLYLGNWDLSFKDDRDKLYRNEGRGVFTDVTIEAGINEDGGATLAALFFDYDNDGRPDLYVAEDLSDDILYHNEGDGTFRDVTALAGVGVHAINAMGIDAADADNDGDLDLYITDSPARASGAWQDLSPGNAYYINGGDGTFKSAAFEARVAAAFSWGTGFGDFDNDGFVDLYVATQHHIPDFLYRNDGNGLTFSEVSAEAGIEHILDSRGVAFSDYDHDGDLDIAVVGRGGAPTLLYRNDTANLGHWLGVRLRGVDSPRDGIGAWVIAEADGKRWMREVHGGGSTNSQHSLLVHLGLGEATMVDHLEVRWPSGRVSELREVGVDRIVEVVEGVPVAVEEAEGAPSGRPARLSLGLAAPNPFNAATSFLLKLPHPGRVMVRVVGPSGQVVRTLVDGFRSGGVMRLLWDGRDEEGVLASSGPYWVEATADGARAVRALAFIK